MIRQIIREYWETNFPEVIERDIDLDIKTDLINDIVGIRRSGKTFLMFSELVKLANKFGKDATIYINFENRKLLPLKKEYFNDIISFIYEEKLFDRHKRVYLFLDEVQRIIEWERYVRSIYDEFKGKLKIFVSSSSANLLSKDYGKLLTGRHLTMYLYPLSFNEFLKFKKFNIKNANKIKMELWLKEYLKYGGFPEVVLSEDKERILGQLFSDVLSKDVLSRADIRKEQIAEEFAYYLSSNISNRLSFNKMSRYFRSRGIKISVQTLENYFYFMRDAFLFFDNLIFSYKVKDQLQYSRKIYCVDTGIANLVGFKLSEDIGKLYENVVAVELFRRSGISKKIFYWHDQQQREVDFVIKEGISVIELIQVCYDINDSETRQRELKALVRASEELKCKNLIVITKDYEGGELIEGKKIKFVTLVDWLLGR